MKQSADRYFSPSARKWALWAHILSSSLWLGSAVAMMLLVIVRDRLPQSPLEVYAFSFCTKLIDDYIIIGTCGVSALSGALLSWKTRWGLLNHWWIVVKIIVTVVMLATGAGFLGPSINETELILRGVREHSSSLTDAVQGTRYDFVHTAVIVVGVIQVVVLATVMWISVFKPWGKTGWFPSPK